MKQYVVVLSWEFDAHVKESRNYTVITVLRGMERGVTGGMVGERRGGGMEGEREERGIGRREVFRGGKEGQREGEREGEGHRRVEQRSENERGKRQGEREGWGGHVTV